jgi:hypothetical protein
MPMADASSPPKGAGSDNAPQGIAMAHHHAAHHQATFLDRVRAEPPMLDADMTPSDIANVLRGLKFARGHPETIKLIDSDVRDYLVRAVTRQGERL